jgi:hypothetical protein
MWGVTVSDLELFHLLLGASHAFKGTIRQKINQLIDDSRESVFDYEYLCEIQGQNRKGFSNCVRSNAEPIYIKI